MKQLIRIISVTQQGQSTYLYQINESDVIRGLRPCIKEALVMHYADDPDILAWINGIGLLDPELDYADVINELEDGGIEVNQHLVKL